MTSPIVRCARRGAIVLLVTPLVAAAADVKLATLKGRVVDEVTGDGVPLVDVTLKSAKKARSG